VRKIKPYNPLDKTNLGASVAEAMLERAVEPLEAVEPFLGAGIYAIYYTGGFGAYGRIASQNSEGEFNVPIYVGKAVPPGARKGNFGLEDTSGTPALHKRLKEHAESIKLAENLDAKDFFCRFLVVEDIWIPLGEALLIAKFSPLWNKLIDGFGNHDPGKGRYNQQRSRWDVLHPGRKWAFKCQGRPESFEQIEEEVKNHLRQQIVPEKPTMFDSD
jgi:hypothetical protein